MYYVIKVIMDDEVRYVFSKNLVVGDITCARKFYSASYARRYIRTHERYCLSSCEVLLIS